MYRTPFRAIAAAVVLGAQIGCNRPAVQFTSTSTLSATTTIGTSPMLAVAPDGSTASAWISAPGGGSDGRLNIAMDSAAPTQLSDSLGPINARSEAPPSMAFAGNDSLYAMYVVAKDIPEKRYPLTALRFVRSTDRGKSWSAPVTVTDDAEFGSHNFHAMHVAHDGTIYISWLGGVLGKSAAWVTHSTDGGATWAPQVRVDSGVSCPCCRTALASGNDGVLYMAWRHVFDGDIRDIVVAHSGDKGLTWSAPVRVHRDNWQFHGCPEAGPAIQVDSLNRVHVAWWTGKQKTAGVWYARSADGGATFSTPTPLGVADFSRPAHVRLGMLGATIVATWDDGTRKTPAIAMRISHDGGDHFGDVQWVNDETRSATFPVLAVGARGVTVAWTEQGTAAVAAEKQAMDKMKDPTTHIGIMPIGQGEVMLRRGTFK